MILQVPAILILQAHPRLSSYWWIYVVLKFGVVGAPRALSESLHWVHGHGSERCCRNKTQMHKRSEGSLNKLLMVGIVDRRHLSKTPKLRKPSTQMTVGAVVGDRAARVHRGSQQVSRLPSMNPLRTVRDLQRDLVTKGLKYCVKVREKPRRLGCNDVTNRALTVQWVSECQLAYRACNDVES